MQSNTAADRKRIAWLEYAKGIGIFTVVVWHVNGGILNAGLDYPEVMGELGKVWDIYAFRYMPIFFFISGIFASRTIGRGVSRFLNDKIRTLAYPYIVWSLIMLLFGSLVAGYTNIGLTLEDFPQMAYEPVMHYWFLYALFVIFVLYAVAYSLKLSVWLMLAIAALMYIVTDALNVIEWSYIVSQIGYFAVFYMLGVVFGPRVITFVETSSTRLLMMIALMCYAVLAVFMLSGVEHALVWLKGFVGLGAMLGAFAVSAVLARGEHLGFIYHWGKYSLEIYVAHVLALAGARIILQHVIGIENGLVHLAVGTVAALYLPLLLVWITQKLHLDFLYRLPRPQQPVSISSTTTTSA